MTKVTLAMLKDVKTIEVCKNQATTFTALVSKKGKKRYINKTYIQNYLTGKRCNIIN